MSVKCAAPTYLWPSRDVGPFLMKVFSIEPYYIDNYVIWSGKSIDPYSYLGFKGRFLVHL